MTALLLGLFDLASAQGAEKISIGQIEQRLRSLRGGAEETVKGAAKPPTLAIAGAGALALLALSYLLGRRRGKKRATVLEIRRV